ncbi:hypothetical protein CW368_10775 [Actinomycetales bacterium SN12]|nr:hypothetical protein CW368_10775 [Actinomycetales bacterium SN12]
MLSARLSLRPRPERWPTCRRMRHRVCCPTPATVSIGQTKLRHRPTLSASGQRGSTTASTPSPDRAATSRGTVADLHYSKEHAVNRRRMTHDDEGFSLVEVVIAMFLFAVLAIAILPLMTGLSQRSAENRTTLSATAFAKEELSKIQAAYPAAPGNTTTSCAALRSLQSLPPVVDPASGFAARVTVDVCPSTFPTSIPLRVIVARGGTDLVTMATRVRVGAA